MLDIVTRHFNGHLAEFYGVVEVVENFVII